MVVSPAITYGTQRSLRLLAATICTFPLPCQPIPTTNFFYRYYHRAFSIFSISNIYVGAACTHPVYLYRRPTSKGSDSYPRIPSQNIPARWLLICGAFNCSQRNVSMRRHTRTQVGIVSFDDTYDNRAPVYFTTSGVVSMPPSNHSVALSNIWDYLNAGS